MNKSRLKQQGAMLITASFLLLFLIGLTAVVVDVGHLMAARTALQNAADAAALAGANCLTRSSAPSGLDCSSTPSAALNWSMANTKAQQAVGLNAVDGMALVDAIVTTGYKNLTGTPAGLQAMNLSPIGPYDKPAVMVQLSKAAGSNGGPLQMLMTSMFGTKAWSLTATAVAVISSPGKVPPNRILPQVINRCMFDLYWDSASNAPRLATSNLLNGVPQVVGQPWVFRIGSSYHYPNCDSGQWSLVGSSDSNSVTGISNQISSGNATALSIGDLVVIEPGTKTALYNNLSAQYPTPPGADVTLAVVNQPNNLDQAGSTPVVGFAGFHIADIKGGNDKYIQGNFIQGGTTAGASGIGAYFGTYTPPRLAQ